MKFFKLKFSFLLPVFLVLFSFSLLHAETLPHTDDFESYSADGYSLDAGNRNELKLKKNDISYKIYDFGSDNANISVNVTFELDTYGGGDESSDYFETTFNYGATNSITIVDTDDYTVKYPTTTDADGKLKVSFKVNTSDNSVYAQLAYVTISMAGRIINNANDICYQTSSEKCTDNTTSQGKTTCSEVKTTTPIEALSDGLSDVIIYFDTSSLFSFFGFGGGTIDDCSVDDGEKRVNCEKRDDASAINFGPMSMFTSGGWVFNLNDMNTDDNRSVSVYDSDGSFFDKLFNFFSSEGALQTRYTKDGDIYIGAIQACGAGGINDEDYISMIDIVDSDVAITEGVAYTPIVRTKVSGKDGYVVKAVYLGTGPSASGLPQKYNPVEVNSKTAPITVIARLADFSPAGTTCETAVPIKLSQTFPDTTPKSTPVIAFINSGEVTQTTNSFKMAFSVDNTTLLSKKNVRFKYKSVDLNQLIIDSGITCANRSSTSDNILGFLPVNGSSTSGNIPGIPQCLNNENNYKDVFGTKAITRCLNDNGQPCKSNHHGVGAAPYDHDYGCLECSLGDVSWSCSQDNFAIRPDSFRVFGENQYKRAGEDFNLTIKAVDKNNSDINTGLASGVQGSVGYNTSTSTLDIDSSIYVPSAADLGQMQTDTGKTNVTTCPHSGTFTVVNNNFVNGEVNSSLSFSETGILNVSVSEKVGSEFAIVDNDDTNESLRLITPSTTIQDKTDISKTNILLFVPYKFETTADYNTTNAKDWIYVNNINGSNISHTTPKMAAFIDYTITAKNEDNDTVHNYTSTCFPDVDEVHAPRVNGLKLNTTFDLFLNATIQSSANQKISLYSEDNSSNVVWAFTTESNLIQGNNSIKEWISPFEFTNGVGKIKVYLNIDRNVSNTLNPRTIRLLDVNTSTSWMSNPGSPKEFNGTSFSTTDPKYSFVFLYGRTHASKQRIEGNSNSASPTNIYFESFCFGTDSLGVDCNLTLLNTVSPNKRRVDDTRWFINEDHNPVNAGEVGLVIEKNSLANITSTVVTSTNPSKRTLTYSGTSFPYKTTMENNASSWLIYDRDNPTATRNKFDVEFEDGTIGWSGQHETDTTTKDDVGVIRSNRRTMW